MPELPEVEIARRNLVHWFKDTALLRATATPSRTFRGADSQAFAGLKGPLVDAQRRGKYLLLRFGRDQGLLAHLGMTGKWVRRAGGETEPYSRAQLELSDGHTLHFRDPRMFGRLEPLPANLLFTNPVIEGLGLDPLVDGLTPASLRAALSRTQQPLKVALMDQTKIAGLGNIHAAESLFRAGLHPSRVPGSLTPAEWTRLTRAIRRTLDFALNHPVGEELDYVEEPGTENPFLIYGRAGTRCSQCKALVRSFVQGGRTTHFCPRCQPAGRLARPKKAIKRTTRRAS